MAEGVLNGSSNTNLSVSIAIHEQELDLANGAVEDSRHCRIVDGLVTVDDAVFVGHIWLVLVDSVEDVRLDIFHLVAEYVACVYVGNGRVDVGKEEWIGLQQSDKSLQLMKVHETYPLRVIVVENRARRLSNGVPLHSGTLFQSES